MQTDVCFAVSKLLSPSSLAHGLEWQGNESKVRLVGVMALHGLALSRQTEWFCRNGCLKGSVYSPPLPAGQGTGTAEQRWSPSRTGSAWAVWELHGSTGESLCHAWTVQAESFSHWTSY